MIFCFFGSAITGFRWKVRVGLKAAVLRSLAIGKCERAMNLVERRVRLGLESTILQTVWSDISSLGINMRASFISAAVYDRSKLMVGQFGSGISSLEIWLPLS